MWRFAAAWVQQIAVVQNPELLELMADATRRGDRASARAVLRALAEAQLLTLSLPRAGAGLAELRAHAGPGGGAFLLAFTHDDALRAFEPGARGVAALRGADLAAVALEAGAAGVVVDPAGPYPGEVAAGDLRWMAEGTRAPDAPDDEPGPAPAPPPEELTPGDAVIATLQEAVDTLDVLREAYAVHDDLDGHLQLGLVVEPYEAAPLVIPAVDALLRPHLGEDGLDLVALRGERLDDARAEGLRVA